MILVTIGLGSNRNDPGPMLARAVSALRERGHMTGMSGLYQSAPMYDLDQDTFLNAVAQFRFDLGPFALLDMLKTLEQQLGRTATRRNGPREIDLDILAFGSLALDSDRLRIPHPGIPERRFVLEPWLEIAPEASIVTYGKLRPLSLLGDVSRQDVRRVADAAI